MATISKGNCYLCGVELGKTAMKNHMLKVHEENGGQECCILKVEGAYCKDYWILIDVPLDKPLSAVDAFLREIWLECCGHMSAFRSPLRSVYEEIAMSRKLKTFAIGEKMLYEYDFGSTTTLLITIMGLTKRKQQREAVRLLARNTPPIYQCNTCSSPAEYICMECVYDTDNPFCCNECIETHEHDDRLLPVTNSPRMGVCGYDGELDTFTFIQGKVESNIKPKIMDTVEPMADEGLPFDEGDFFSELQNKEYSDLSENTHLFLQNMLIAASCAPIYSISEAIAQKKVPLLKLIAKLFRIKGYSSMTKARLVYQIAETITNKDVLKWYLEDLEDREWALFKKVVNADYLVDELASYEDIVKINTYCLVFVYRVDMHIYYVVPHEIRQAFIELEKKDFSVNKDHALMLNKYALAATNLYGVIKKSDFVSIFNKQNKRKTDEAELNELLLKFIQLGEEGYILIDDYVVSYEYDENDAEELFSTIKEQALYPRYLPKMDELLNYADLNYVEDSPQLHKLQLFIDELFTLETDEAESLLAEMYFTAHAQTDVQVYVNMLKEHDIKLSQEKRKVLASLINDLATNVRLWYYNGHTVTELLTMGVIEQKSAHTSERESYRNVLSISDAEGFKYHLDSGREHGNALQPKNEPVRVVKIGRNEPCPCDSGKKYKRCCGS